MYACIGKTKVHMRFGTVCSFWLLTGGVSNIKNIIEHYPPKKTGDNVVKSDTTPAPVSED